MSRNRDRAARPLRLLQVLEPSGGGSGRHFIDLCRGLKQRGHVIHAIYSPRRAEERFVGELAALFGHGHPAEAVVDPASPASEFGRSPRDSIERFGASFSVDDISSPILSSRGSPFDLEYGVGLLVWTLAGSAWRGWWVPVWRVPGLLWPASVRLWPVSRSWRCRAARVESPRGALRRASCRTEHGPLSVLTPAR